MSYFTANLTREEEEVRAELARQNAKWGEQNHPDGTAAHKLTRVPANVARSECQEAATDGRLTWRHILAEEVAEAFAEEDPEKLHAELLQVEAVARQWRIAIRRRPTAESEAGR